VPVGATKNMNILTDPSILLLQGQPGGGGFGFLLPMVFVFAIFYFLIIRPQQRKQKQAQAEREALLNAIKAGDKVVTSSGIYGTIVSVKENTVQLRIAQSVSVEMLRSSIAGLQSSDVKEVETAKQ
jgi:preprotein translocase subunit YajC